MLSCTDDGVLMAFNALVPNKLPKGIERGNKDKGVIHLFVHYMPLAKHTITVRRIRRQK